MTVEERLGLRGETGGVGLEKWWRRLCRRLKYSVHFDRYFTFSFSLVHVGFCFSRYEAKRAGTDSAVNCFHLPP